MLSNEQINEIHRLHWHQKWSLRQIVLAAARDGAILAGQRGPRRQW